MFTVLAIFSSWLDQHTYESELEEYIVKNNPQTVIDVELLTREFEQKSRDNLSAFHMR